VVVLVHPHYRPPLSSVFIVLFSVFGFSKFRNLKTMVSALQNDTVTPGIEVNPSMPQVVLSTIPAATPRDSGRSAHAAQQALYRGISHPLGSTCRPLVYSSLTNRYSPSTVPAEIPQEHNSFPVQYTHQSGNYDFENTSRLAHQSTQHGVYCRGALSAPPRAKNFFSDPSDGYFRDPFLPPVFGPGQQYFASAFNPRDLNYPYYQNPPPPPHRWCPPPEVVTEEPVIPDYLSDEFPVESNNVGCQVDDMSGHVPPIPVYSPPPVYPPFGISPSHIHMAIPVTPQDITPVVVKDAPKFSLPAFDNKKMTWSDYARKLRAALVECEMSYLLTETETNPSNAKHSKQLMLEFYKKLEGSAAKLFDSMEAMNYYMDGGRGIEMLLLLASTFNPMDADAIKDLILKLTNLECSASQDLSSYFDEITDINSQLSWVGQSFPVPYLLQLATGHLEKSRFAAHMTTLKTFHTAAKTNFTSLDDLKQGLIRLDPARGLATTAATVTPPSTKPGWRRKGAVEGLVSAIGTSSGSPLSEVSPAPSDVTMHQLAWVGACDLDKAHVLKIKSLFKCPLCRSNAHSWPVCEFLVSKWDIKKKPDDGKTGSRKTPAEGSASAVSGGGDLLVLSEAALQEMAPAGPAGTANSVRFATSPEFIPVDNRFAALTVDDDSTVEDDSVSVDEHDVVFDHEGEGMLSSELGVTSVTSGTGSFYSAASSRCVGSARSIRSTEVVPSDPSSLIPPTFDIVADSGATSTMVPWKELFISYRTTPGSYVILANNQRTPCLGRGDIRINMGGYTTIISNVLHIPALRCPLYSIRSHSRIRGCGFHADNKGTLLAFPTFILPVDLSYDCVLKGSFPSSMDTVHFDERSVGNISAVSDNTRNRSKRRGCLSPPVAHCQVTQPNDSPVSPSVAPSIAPLVAQAPISSPSPLVSSEPVLVEDVNEDEESLCDDSASTDDDNTGMSALLGELGLDAELLASPPGHRLSQKQIGEIAQACVDHLTKHGRITNELLTFLASAYPSTSSFPTSRTPDDRPELLSSDKMPSSAAATRRFTVPQLHRYLGFRQLKNWSTILDIAQENISLNLNHGDIPVELGNVANLKKSRANKTPVPRPKHFLSRVHMDIGYGDCVAVGGSKYCVLLVDRATRYTWIYGLKNLTHESLTSVLQQFRRDAGNLPKVLLTDFDNKILSGPTEKYLLEHQCHVRAAPPKRQNENGLVERAWGSVTAMARSYITDMQMPRCYWYWALRHAVHVINYLPCTVNTLTTSPHELVYGVKPDYRTLFRLFSTGYFKHEKDSDRARDGIAEAKSMSGIAIGRCRKTDGLLFYCPHTKVIYSSGDFKLDEGRNTPNTFNLQYEGGIFVGMYDSASITSQAEPFPQGTPVVFPLEDCNKKIINMRGTVISVPVPNTPSQLPRSDAESPPYVIRLVDGTTHRVSPLMMDDIVAPYCRDSANPSIQFPSWLRDSQKVMFLKDGQYVKGIMEYDLDNTTWRFSQQRRNGVELWGVAFPNFAQNFQKYIDDGSIIPGWHNKGRFQPSFVSLGSAGHISAAGLSSPIPPGSLTKAMRLRGDDLKIWQDSYREEFDGLHKSNCFEIITEEEYQSLLRVSGKRAIPSMCVFTVKKDSQGRPFRAKSRIVVLGNKDPREWTKADCFAPVVSLPVVRMLTALAVQHKRTLKQGDCKLAFVQATLPPEELTIVKPPVGCPHSGPNTYWRLKKSLYGLKRAPRHWYKLISKVLTSPEIGLTQCRNDPCVYYGTLIPGQPPLYLAIYVDDLVYFSPSDDVEKYFEQALAQKITVDFMGEAEFFLGLKFDWFHSDDGHVDCRISQEAYANTIVNELGLSQANVNPLMTPFRSGFPIDTIPVVEMSPEARAPLVGKMQCWLGMINWLTMGTRPDLSTVFSLLASHTNSPSPGHLDAVKHLGRYIKSTADLGLLFSSRRNITLESYVYFPVNGVDDLQSGSTAPTLLGFCDANWGPQDASVPSVSDSSCQRIVSPSETRSICGHVLMMGGAPVFWKCHKESRISRSSTEAEVKATDECTKSVQMFRHLLGELDLINLNLATAIYNDNRGAVNWSNTSSTKGMRHVNIRENAIREAIHEYNEVTVSHIPGAQNPSDIFTKEFKSDAIFRQLRGLLLFYPSSICDVNAPRLDGGC